jgi:Raf kinase inhibitor-like YbhB/YbcL family protein
MLGKSRRCCARLTLPQRELAAALVVVAIVASSCADSTQRESHMPITDEITVSSDAFTDGAALPERHTCDGDNVSPPLDWSGAPDGTAAYVLIVDDPDARGFIHWVAADIPADTTSLADGASGTSPGTEGRNDFGGTGWGGPCPPSGTHRYVFTVYALSEPLGLEGTPDASAVRRAMEGRMLAQGRLIGTYRRGG